MSGRFPLHGRCSRALVLTAALAAVFGSLGCREKKPAPIPQPTNAPPPRVAPPAAPTNAPPKDRFAGHTPAELFQTGLKLWEGRGVERDAAEAVQLFRAAAKGGSTEAQAYLGAAYRSGTGVPVDVTEALHWFREAAGQGHVRSQGVLGSMYGTGEAGARDFTEAAKWYRLAAEQGLVAAQANLGAMHYLGQGVARDPVEAYKWLHLAAQKGDQGAVKNRGMVAQKMTTAQMAEGRKRAAEFTPKKAAAGPP